MKKLIEVSLPLEAVNKESAREKSIRRGHPSTLHLWWSRKPLATTRAVIWASLVDDPSEHPEIFPTKEAQNEERKRLFGILERLVKWENTGSESVLREARGEIAKYTGGKIPELLDPFAGGGSIPLEAQRLGLRVHAHDLNPIAVMINKAMIEIPACFAGLPPVNPDSRLEIGHDVSGDGSSGLARDVAYYGARMKQEAFRRIGSLYPRIKTPEGDSAVIAWIWARTVRCPNPACGCHMPLVNSFVLSKKSGKEAYIKPEISEGRITYRVVQGKPGKNFTEGTVTRSGAKCFFCGTPAGLDYVRAEAKAGRMGASLMAVVAEGEKGRLYLSPDDAHIKAADVPCPDDYPDGEMPPDHHFSPRLYGMPTYASLFTPRQLTMLTTLSGLIPEIQREAENDAIDAGMSPEMARRYSEAVSVYLAFVVDKMTDYHSSICSWHNSGEKMRNTFSRQAIPMVWNYAEGNPFSDSSGNFMSMLEWITENIERFPCGHVGEVSQSDARKDCGLRDVIISTDPPYYDNIGYSDLSDFFYIWLRRSLRKIYPELFRAMTAPKNEELIATPYRHNNSADEAREFFEDGMLQACRNIYRMAGNEIPVTIYYAYKQKDTENKDGEKKEISVGWETMLSAVINAGFEIVRTWPMRTERPTALKKKVSALASSIVLVCRKRPEDSPACTKRKFLEELKRELDGSLRILQESNISPVDMPQSAIGPGMAVYSRYSCVRESDGREIGIREALQMINKAVEEYFGERDSDIDGESRFCVELYRQRGFNVIHAGDAINIAQAKGTSLDVLSRLGMIRADGGEVRLLDRDEIDIKPTNDAPPDWILTQKLTRAMSEGGRELCAKILAPLMNTDAPERAKNLAYRLHDIADRKHWTSETAPYNDLVQEWEKIKQIADKLKDRTAEQLSIGFGVTEKEGE